MAINGRELAVGQTWKTRGNEVVTISATNGSQVYPWLIKHQEFSYSVDACGFAVNDLPGYENAHDLVEYVKSGVCATVGQPTTSFTSAGDEHETLTFHDIMRMQSAGVMMADQLARPAPAPRPAGSVGDINSQAKGSGARYNAGKPPYELVPLRIMARYYRAYLSTNQDLITDSKQNAVVALECLSSFQERTDGQALIEVLLALEMPWPSCAKVFDYGKGKYREWNWTKGMAWSIPIACAARHLEAIILGEDKDPESGELHAGHVACNIVMLVTFERTFPEGDDRATAGLLAPVVA